MKDIDWRTLIDTVKERIDITEVVGRYVSLDRHHKALCPFHTEKTPSFSVNPAGQYFHCFGCGAGGDVIKFLQLYEQKPFMEVLRGLAEQVGVPLPALTAADTRRMVEDRVMGEILGETARFYHRNLTQEVREYLQKERGFTVETITRFQLGFAGGGLARHLTESCSFPIELCEKAGVVRKTATGTVEDFYQNRVIFPNVRRGRIVHLTGRTLDGREPKYLHLPGEIRYMYNEDALSHEKVVISEGVTDCLSLEQAGHHAVAILGTSGLKQEFVPKFARSETIYLCLDGDEAGRKATMRHVDLFGERARVIELPDGLDPNSYLKTHSKEEFDALVAEARDPIKYQLSLIPPDTDKTELPQLLAPILDALARMDKAKGEAYLSYEIKARFGLKAPDVEGYRDFIERRRKETGAPTVSRATSAEDTPQLTATFPGLVDLVDDRGHVAFLVKDGGGVSISREVVIDGTRYVPPVKSQIPWLLPDGERVLDMMRIEENLPLDEINAALFDDLIAHHKGISHLPASQYYELAAAWVIHTYLQESSQYSPIICLFAVPERGKSRTGKGLINVAYRGVHVESLRDPYIVRLAHDLHASLFFDVKDIWRKAEKCGAEDILLHRFERGATVPRVLYPDRGPHQDIRYYSIFGPTIIATNEGVHRILETRCIQINMPTTRRRFESDVTPEAAIELKTRLLAFRARHLSLVLPDIRKPARGRLGDILKPMQQVILLTRPGRVEGFLALVKELESDRMAERVDTLEAQIVASVAALSERVEHGILSNKAITDTLNADRPDRQKLTPARVAGRLKALGFSKVTTSTGAGGIHWDQAKLSQLEEQYGLHQTSEASGMSVSPDELADFPDDTDVPDLFQGVNAGGADDTR